MIITLLFTSLAFAGPKTPAPDFKSLKSPNSFPVDCVYKAQSFNGRFRMSAMGELHLLVADKGKRYECVMRIDHVTQGTASVVPTASLHFQKVKQCTPELTPALEKALNVEPELVMTYKGMRLWIQAREDAAVCDILKYDRKETARVVKEFTTVTGTGRDAERSIEFTPTTSK